jgi:hypothetical protein
MGEWERGRNGEGRARANATGASSRAAKVGLFCLIVRISRASLCKTGEVLRFCDHGGAARSYKSGICRGFCVEIVLDLWAGAVGFLIKKAQRAGVGGARLSDRV